jgi:hypothetical protein
MLAVSKKGASGTLLTALTSRKRPPDGRFLGRQPVLLGIIASGPHRVKFIDPERLEIAGHTVLESLDLSIGNMFRQNLEDGLYDALGVYLGIIAECLGYVGEKFLLVPFLQGFAMRVPALVIDATDQQWQLRRKSCSVINGQAVAQRMKHGPQRLVSAVLVFPAQSVHDFVEPDVGDLESTIEGGQAGLAHRFLLCSGKGAVNRPKFKRLAAFSNHFDLIGKNRQPDCLHHFMLRELFRVIGATVPAQYHAATNTHQAKPVNSPGKPALDEHLQFGSAIVC